MELHVRLTGAVFVHEEHVKECENEKGEVVAVFIPMERVRRRVRRFRKACMIDKQVRKVYRRCRLTKGGEIVVARAGKPAAALPPSRNLVPNLFHAVSREKE
jgi:hypothetical protein